MLIGLTNMPPMANGGMQRGVYGRAESPYNADYLTAAFGSGSSNGSGTATAASFAAFGLGEETWSSGRAPASNNALCAYTPSRGVISVRGNWPLVPTMDVVVPHTRTMADLLEVLDVIVADDAETRGDFWRVQPWVSIPRSSEVRPASYVALRPSDASGAPDAAAARAALAGKRFGVPRMYVNADPDAGTAEPGRTPGIGGATGQRIETRASVIELWEAARRDLEAAGAEVVEVDFPVVSNYEGDRPGAPTIATRGLVAPEYLRREIVDLSAWSWDDFLRGQRRPRATSRSPTSTVPRIFPHPEGALPDRYTGFDDDIAEYPEWARTHPGATFADMPELEAGLRGLEETRRVDLEEWMDGARTRRRRVPGGRRRRPRRHGRERGIRRSRLAQRRLGRERQPGAAAPRHPDGDGAHGHHARHPACRSASPSPDAPTTTRRCSRSPPRSRRPAHARTAPPRTPPLG